MVVTRWAARAAGDPLTCCPAGPSGSPSSRRRPADRQPPDADRASASGPRTGGKEADKVRTLLRQVDEGRSPRTRPTVNQLLDRYLEVVDFEKSTRRTYEGYIERHTSRTRPTPAGPGGRRGLGLLLRAAAPPGQPALRCLLPAPSAQAGGRREPWESRRPRNAGRRRHTRLSAPATVAR